MFDSLSDKLGGVLDSLRGRKKLSEDDVNMAAREIRVALLEADVALPVVKDFITSIKEQAVGQEIVKSVTAAQQVVKIVNDGLIELLGSEQAELNIDVAPPASYLMVGLQGSGKTTSTAKLAKMLSEKHRKKVLMASLDIYRPAAQDQLRVLGEQINVATLDIIAGQDPVTIANRAMETARKEGFDLVLLDTAGRLSIDEDLMEEIANIKKATNPVETLLVADAMTGQDAVQTATAFDERVDLSGIILTRIDGDARGGAALSMRSVTGKPIKFMGTGEKTDALEPFHPDRLAGRILGMGDVVSLVEKAVETVDEEEAKKLAKKFEKGKFDLDDFAGQLQQMKKMGGMGSLLKMLPGVGKIAGQLDGMDIEGALKYQEAIMSSMTKKERQKPALINASRRKRIAAGSGTSVQEVNRLLKQFSQMQKMMSKMRKMGKGNMMRMMKDMMGNDPVMMQAAGVDPAAEMPDENDPLGPNPFAQGSPDPFGGLGGMGGMAGLPGMPSPRGGSKKNRRKKNKR